MEKIKALNKKDPKKARETEFLISYYQNPKYPLIFFVRYWFMGVLAYKTPTLFQKEAID
ncbi:hypothetical protein [Helicobacter pylori]|uniref:Uncharacterized protein n=1 Tax=Helicobacter pylori GAM265BSii TaxID=1159049 RepID=M3RH51_HELPX|nr:hypothetical protein [Helicobacter pylori]EMH30717.1 hypothetical protein HMPREF1421_00164 [Helicobacter pylori GAM265BSii]